MKNQMKKIILTLFMAVLALHLFSQATAGIEQLSNAVPGNGFPVAVTANFSGVSGGVSAFQFDITFDATCLTFTGLQNTAFSGIQYNLLTSGTLRLIWTDNNVHSLLNGKLLDLVFAYNGGNSNLNFITANCFVSKAGAIPVSTTYTNGWVHMVTPVPGLVISTVNGVAGQTVNVPLTSSQFYNVGGFTLKINFVNPAVVTGSTVSLANINAAVSTLLSSSYIGGLLSITWSHPGGNNISIANGTKLFDLQFTFAGGTSAINFNTSTSNVNSYVYPFNPYAGVTYTNGSVSGPAVIITNPSNQTVNLGANTSFSVTATGATAYQWKVSSDGGGTYANVTNTGVYSNAGTATLNITAATAAINSYKYKCVVEPGAVNSTEALSTVNPLTVNARVILQGTYNGSNMNTALNSLGHIPLSQPYTNTAPWFYTGNENVLSIPNANVVDWVLVELRTGTSSGTMVSKKTGFVLKDGSVVGTDGASPLAFPLLESGSYYIVVRHRNHLAIMSATSQALNSISTLYDFTTAATKAYSLNYTLNPPMATLAGGKFGLWGGNAGLNNWVRYGGPNNDPTAVLAAVGTSVVYGYLQADVNMNGAARYGGPGNDPTNILSYVGTVVATTQVP